MPQSTNTSITFISTQHIQAKESKELKWLILYVCIAYHYKVIFCGLLGKVL
jgi:hypothetical protein